MLYWGRVIKYHLTLHWIFKIFFKNCPLKYFICICKLPIKWHLGNAIQSPLC